MNFGLRRSRLKTFLYIFQWYIAVGGMGIVYQMIGKKQFHEKKEYVVVCIRLSTRLNFWAHRASERYNLRLVVAYAAV